MEISPRLATRTLRIRCELAGFNLRFTDSRGQFDHSRWGESMSRLKIIALLCWSSLAVPVPAAEQHPVAIAIHGGAGVIERAKMTPAREAAYRAGLAAALNAGYTILEHGGTSLDAVAAAVRTMEDDPQFNAGRGAVLDAHGDAELDAAIMDGNGPRAGAVAGVRHVKNPIDLARLVMDKSPHVLLVAAGAEEFALEQGVVLVSPDYFRTEERIHELQEAQRAARERAAAPPNALPKGTVGAVALDRAGNLAAATSTGGLTNKQVGRVGDTPIIGAGTYANNESCAVSGTGWGEFFMRELVAYDICAQMHYRHLTLRQAVHAVIHEKLARGTGGVIAIDPHGDIVMDFNTPGMLRAARDLHGRQEIAMFSDGQ
jgi:beta-aspartyl-peptidase (threonine type)